MGFVYLMMEFEITDGSINFATVAMSNENNFEEIFDANYAKPTYDENTDMLKGIGDFGKIVESNILEYYIDNSTISNTNLQFKTDTLIPNNENTTNSFVTNTSPIYYLCKNRTPISSSLKLRYDTYYNLNNGEEKYNTLFFDTYHSPKTNPYIIPDVVKVGPYAIDGKNAWKSNEQFDSKWFESLADTNYNSYESTLSDDLEESAKNFENFLGMTNMQGYGVTFKYNIVIHNLSDFKRKFVYHTSLNRQYRICCFVNGEMQDINEDTFNADGRYDNDIYTIEIKPYETSTITIETTELAGASATNENWFVIQ